MWTGKAIIRPGWAVFLGTAGDHLPHRHHAVQVAVGIQDHVKLWAEEPGDLSVPGVVIAADHSHQLASGPEPLLLLYLERESALGRTLDDWCSSRARPLSALQAQQLAHLLAKPDAVDLPKLEKAVAVIRDFAPAVSSKAFADQRIAQILAELPQPLPESITAAELARMCGLSPSRFAHLLRAHTGMPLRPYLRWLRLQQALIAVARGSNLTDAAYAAGFSDSAHLSRSFRRTFGIAPNVLLNPALAIKHT